MRFNKMLEKNQTNWNQPQSNRTKYAKSNSQFKTINGFELSNSFIHFPIDRMEMVFPSNLQ